MRIEPASDMDEVRAIFREYAQSLGVDLQFQGFEDELAALPDFYLTILVARASRAGVSPASAWGSKGTTEACTTPVAACVALRHLDDETCEMKRLYVRPAWRGRDLGRTLALRIIDEARARGYRTMRLDTLPGMNAATALYESLGFVDIEPYRYNPVAGSRFLELTL